MFDFITEDELKNNSRYYVNSNFKILKKSYIYVNINESKLLFTLLFCNF